MVPLRKMGDLKKAGGKIVELIRRPKIRWGDIAKGATDAGISPILQIAASEFFKHRLTEKKEKGSYTITRVDLHTAIMNGILLDELIDMGNPTPELVEVIRVFDFIPFVDLKSNLESVVGLLSDGRVIAKAIQECRPDLWSVILNTPGYGEKWLGESATGIITKIEKIMEGLEA